VASAAKASEVLPTVHARQIVAFRPGGNKGFKVTGVATLPIRSGLTGVGSDRYLLDRIEEVLGSRKSGEKPG